MELNFYVEISEENKFKCLSRKFGDYTNKEEIDFLSQLREGILILVIKYNHNHSDYYSELKKVVEYDNFIGNYTRLKPSSEEDFKFDEGKNTRNV
uniref:Galectin n=1 Tax=Meloidogyne floridensis TaxID=298350 RepID=A0A915P8I0_9BILA